MSKTKIVVFQLKEIIYTAIFVGLGILLILLLIFMFLPKNKDTASLDTQKYKAGKYTSEVVLNDTSLNIEVVVDENHINSVNITNIDDTVTAMYPLVEPALADISEQLCNDVDINDIKISSQNSKYTEALLLETVKETLKKATP